MLRRLLDQADVLVENFRVGGLDRLGFDDAELERLNPGLVHLAISGYGPDGLDRAKPGYDFVLQAEAGLMSITGFPDEAGGEPTKVGVAISRRRHGSVRRRVSPGRPRSAASEPDPRPAATASGSTSPSSRSTLAVLVNQAQNAFVTGRAPVRRGNAHPNIVPYETFATADGELAVAVGSERQWPRFCAAIGLESLTDDPRFATNGDRVDAPGGAAADPRRAPARAGCRRAGWRFSSRRRSRRPINDVLAAFALPQARARRMTVDVEHPVLGRRPPGRRAVRAVGHAGDDPLGAAAPRRAHRRDPGRARL